jgi:Family of unknown function (DUF6221)
LEENGASDRATFQEATMSELADFILARIDEEEQACRARLYGPPRAADDVIAPGRLLLHNIARRKLVALHEIHVVDDGASAMLDGESGSCRAGRSERAFVCPTLRLLALPYFDHPDFQPQWQCANDFVSPDTGRPRLPA